MRHRLQGFNPAYFTRKSGLFSYSADNYRALEGRNSKSSRPFVEEPLAEIPDEECAVTIDDLVRFFANPAAFFLDRRLGLKPSVALQPLEEREPFGADGLDAFLMRQEMLEALLDGGQAQSLLPLFRSRGLLPPATHGELLFRELLVEVREFGARLLELKGDLGYDVLEANLDVGGIRITGRLENLLPSVQLLYRCAKMKEKDRIRSWIYHLVLDATGGSHPQETQLVMLDRSIRYRPVEDAVGHLETLLSLYRAGLTEPLPFFPRASLAWAGKVDKTERDRLEAAEAAWREGYGNREGEGADPAFRRCFGTEPPFDERFGTIADTLLAPMIAHGGKT
jgi:exodeoxyribonuclease V gamma subunit